MYYEQYKKQSRVCYQAYFHFIGVKFFGPKSSFMWQTDFDWTVTASFVFYCWHFKNPQL